MNKRKHLSKSFNTGRRKISKTFLCMLSDIKVCLVLGSELTTNSNLFNNELHTLFSCIIRCSPIYSIEFILIWLINLKSLWVLRTLFYFCYRFSLKYHHVVEMDFTKIAHENQIILLGHQYVDIQVSDQRHTLFL